MFPNTKSDSLSRKLKERYDATEGDDSFKDSLKEILNMVDVNQRIVLDIGCGRGDKTLAYLNKGARLIIGVDLSITGIKRAKENIPPRAKDKIIFIVGNAEKLPIKSDIFDTTVSSEVLEHVPDMEAAISEMERVTKDGGQILVTSPSYFNITGLFKIAIDKIIYKGEERWTGHGVEILEHRLTPFTLKKLLTRNNIYPLEYKGRDLWNGLRPLFRIPFILIINFFDFIIPRIFNLLKIEKLTNYSPFKYFGEDQYIKAQVKKNAKAK